MMKFSSSQASDQAVVRPRENTGVRIEMDARNATAHGCVAADGVR